MTVTDEVLAANWRRSCERLDRLNDGVSDALGTVLATPSPDLASLVWKLRRFLGLHNDHPHGWPAMILEPTLGDIDRLLVTDR